MEFRRVLFRSSHSRTSCRRCCHCSGGDMAVGVGGYAGPMSTDTDPLVDAPARAGGAALAGATRVLSALRRPAKPLHPLGTVLTGVLRRHGGAEPSGVPWLDETGEDAVLVRLSRAVGLPAPLPDIFGLALRMSTADGRPADLLLATTGGS